MNGFIKDGAREAIDDRSDAGFVASPPRAFWSRFQLFAANMRKIDEFLASREAEGKKVRKLPSRHGAHGFSPAGRRSRLLPLWMKPAAILTHL